MRRLVRFEYENTVRDLLGTGGIQRFDFPAEESVLGFTNNAVALAVSPLLAETYFSTAEALAAAAVADLDRLVPCEASGRDTTCAEAFIASFGKRAFRRPLTAEETARFQTVFARGRETGGFGNGIRLVVVTALVSPRFLFRVEEGAPGAPDQTSTRLTPWEIATRLSYLVWGSMPDDELFAAAETGKLETAEDIARQARRMMVSDPRAKAQARQFYEQWLGVHEIGHLEKDSALHPAFGKEIALAMEEEVSRFVEDAFWSRGSVRKLFRSSTSFMNAPLAKFYGAKGPTGTSFEPVELDASQRAGLLTLGGMLARTTEKPDQTSPVYRGKFVREQLLCSHIPDPPPGIVVEPPEVSDTLTTRQRFTMLTAGPACQPCHKLMEPIGFALETYDSVGRWRTTENGQVIDDAGHLYDTDVDGPFRGAVALSHKLGESAQAAGCVATQWFRFASGRAETNGDACTLRQLQDRVAGADGSLADLAEALTRTLTFQRLEKGVAP